MTDINTHGLHITFGKHNGKRWTRVPADYLRWLINQPPQDGKPEWEEHKKIARAELDRRGTVVSHEVELTPHAIDRASLALRKIWHLTSDKGEGLYSWLSRVATEASEGATDKPEKVTYLGIHFIFKWGVEYPVLKTVMRQKGKDANNKNTK